MMWEYGDAGSGADWWPMVIGMVLFWGVVIAALVMAYRHLGSSGSRRVAEAEAILAQRFARGELTDEEYAAKRTLLHSGL